MTQNQKVLQYMKENNGITTYTAFKMGITRLSARIAELIEEGYPIQKKKMKYKASDGKTKMYTLYSIETKKG